MPIVLPPWTIFSFQLPVVSPPLLAEMPKESENRPLFDQLPFFAPVTLPRASIASTGLEAQAHRSLHRAGNLHKPSEIGCRYVRTTYAPRSYSRVSPTSPALASSASSSPSTSSRRSPARPRPGSTQASTAAATQIAVPTQSTSV
jgi:hypothetical protein